jgi:molybdopterin/thiamine biosynthesis adenylyltransferase
MSEMAERLRALAGEETEVSKEPCRIIDLASLKQFAAEFGLTRRQAEVAALRQRVLPARYMRNLGTVGWEGQIALLEATVGVAGAGGLGGWIIEGLARMGLGRLILVDSDVFSENNLNRQAFCREDNLGQSKVEAATQRVAAVNAAVEVIPHHKHLNGPKMMARLFRGCNVLVDALDSLPTRLDLQRAARDLGVPLVHGAIAGYVGQVMTILPDDEGLLGLYGQREVPQQGIEVQWGNPAATPMMAASWQIAEVVKLLAGRGEPLSCRMLFMDSETGTVDLLQV